jgi:peptidoglycan/LPS O-acetylase OafA/YrhL
MRYRADIDGLRALAVLPVIFFHANVPLFQGGFLGVDVFFVISGFLISSIVVKNLKSNAFSFLSFWDKRIRRIIPALFLVTFFTSILSVFLMLPNDLKSYGQSIVATILSANNILLYLTSGYWSHAADFKPLYHTWSLGVEEQFYLVMPFLIYLVYKITKSNRGLYVLFVTILCCSAFFSLTIANDEFVFLMIITRAWELLAGAILALILERKKSHLKRSYHNSLSFLGLVLIIFSYINPYWISSVQFFVSFPVVFGSFLIILFSVERTVVYELLTTKYLVFIGTISYSVYLFHQPILAFFRLGFEAAPHYLILLSASIFSIPLGYLSHRYVEQFFRDSNKIGNKSFYFLVSVITFVFIGIGLVFHVTYGLEQYRSDLSYGGNPKVYVDRVHSFDGMKTKYSESNLLFVGNSFARDLVNSYIEYSNTDYNAVNNVSYFNGSCKELMNLHSEKVNNFQAVIITSNWSRDSSSRNHILDLKQCVSLLKNLTPKLFIVGDKNFGWNNNFIVKYFLFNESANHDFFVDVDKRVLDFNSKLEHEFPSYFVDPITPLMNEKSKVPIFTGEGYFITFDTDHLTPKGAGFVGDYIFTETILNTIIE